MSAYSDKADTLSPKSFHCIYVSSSNAFSGWEIYAFSISQRIHFLTIFFPFKFLYFLFYISITGLCYPIANSSLGGVIKTWIIGYRFTRIRTLVVLSRYVILNPRSSVPTPLLHPLPPSPLPSPPQTVPHPGLSPPDTTTSLIPTLPSVSQIPHTDP